jgi:outer membrane immunogenic protein
MRKCLLSAMLLITVTALFAQNPLIRKDVILQSGFGFSFKEMSGIPFYLGVAYGLTNEMSIGGEFSNSVSKTMVNRAIKAKWSYHLKRALALPEKWDIYGGVGLGYYTYSLKNGSQKENGPDISAHIGLSHFFSYKFGVNLEYGAGNAFTASNSPLSGKIGVSLKL